MLILLITLIAHIIFTFTDAYWLFSWLDMLVHFFMGAGLAFVFVRRLGWGGSMAIVVVMAMAIGWEYIGRLLGFSEELRESLDDVSTDVLTGVAGAIIGANYAKRR